jgi:hypothetical protein
MKTTRLWKILCLGLCLFLLIGLSPSSFAQSEESEEEEEELVQTRPNPMEQTMKDTQTVRTLNTNVQKQSVKDAGGKMAMPAGDGASMQLQGETQGMGNVQMGTKAALPAEKNVGTTMK